MQVDDEPPLSLEDACDSFGRAGHEQHKLLAANGQNLNTVSASLIERLLTPGPWTQADAKADVEHLVPVMERTGFSVDEAARTLLLWQEISNLRGEGLDTVTIVQHLTKRLKGSTHACRGRGHLTEAGRNAAEVARARTKQKHSRWSEFEETTPTLSSPTKRSRLQ